VSEDLTERVALLFERRAAGEVLNDDDAEDLRIWYVDHPVHFAPVA
jgi:hypothetical protein